METVSLLNDLNPATLFDSPAFDFPDALSSQKREVFSSSREWTIGFPLAKRRNAFLKRIIDITGAAILILLIFPWFLPLVAICIKLDSKGSVFFTQRRSKKGGRQFTCIKLRTMVENAEAHSVAAYENDPRITCFGAFLRRNHLDELTQLINVLLGDMSLIGPRPYMITDNERCEALIAGYQLRHSIKPGITGLAQSLGHYGLWADRKAIKKRFELDLLYLKNWSLKMDAQIVARTLRMSFQTFKRKF